MPDSSAVASFFLKAIFNKNEYDKAASRSTGDEVLPGKLLGCVEYALGEKACLFRKLLTYR
jgi:hypothetical protein